jgi:hypothetical protein
MVVPTIVRVVVSTIVRVVVPTIIRILWAGGAGSILWGGLWCGGAVAR